MVLLTLTLACSGGGLDDTGRTPAPWSVLEPRELSVLQPFLFAPLTLSVVPTRVTLLSERPHAFVLDADAGRVHVFDDRYRHEGITNCVDVDPWPKFPVDATQQGSCAEGEVALSRGVLHPDGDLRGVAVDPDSLRVHLWSGGQIYSASAELLHGSPWDYLRLGEPLPVAVPEPVQSVAMTHGDGALWLASDRWLGRVELDGTITAEHVLPDLVLDLVWSGEEIWAATESGVWSPGSGVVSEVPAPRLASDQIGGVWLVDEDRERALRVGAAGVVSVWDTPGATGPLAFDGTTGRLVVATRGGLAVYEDETRMGSAEGLQVRDLAVNDHHEVVALTADGLQVFGDELSLGSGARCR